MTRWLGEYNPDMPMDEIHRRLDHFKLTAIFRESFEMGFKAGLAGKGENT